MGTYLDTIEKETRNVTEIAFEMEALSTAFYATGNISMGETLGFASKQLMDSQKSITNAVATEISGRCEQAEQSAFNTVAACLAISELKGR